MALLEPLVWVADITRAVYIGLYIIFTLLPAGILSFLLAFIIGPRAVGGSRLVLVMLFLIMTFALWVGLSYWLWGTFPWEVMQNLPVGEGGVDIA